MKKFAIVILLSILVVTGCQTKKKEAEMILTESDFHAALLSTKQLTRYETDTTLTIDVMSEGVSDKQTIEGKVVMMKNNSTSYVQSRTITQTAGVVNKELYIEEGIEDVTVYQGEQTGSDWKKSSQATAPFPNIANVWDQLLNSHIQIVKDQTTPYYLLQLNEDQKKYLAANVVIPIFAKPSSLENITIPQIYVNDFRIYVNNDKTYVEKAVIDVYFYPNENSTEFKINTAITSTFKNYNQTSLSEIPNSVTSKAILQNQTLPINASALFGF